MDQIPSNSKFLRNLFIVLGAVVFLSCGAIFAVWYGIEKALDRSMPESRIEELKEEYVQAFEEAYPGKTFEVYDTFTRQDFYGAYTTFYFRCLQDGVEFDYEPASGPLDLRLYMTRKWWREGREEVEKSFEEIFGRECAVYFRGGGRDLPYSEVDKNVFEVMKECEKTETKRFFNIIYFTEDTNIDVEDEAGRIYELYYKYKPKYSETSKYYYDFSVVYLEPGVSIYSVTDGKKRTEYSGNEMAKTVSFDKGMDEPELEVTITQIMEKLNP